jgi:hypothetical protein
MSETQNRPDAWTRLWRTIGHVLGTLLRLLFVIVLAVLLAAGVYFGAPWVYRQLIQPVQSSVTQLALLQRQMDESDAQWVQSFADQQERIADLETHLADQAERITSLEASVGRLEQGLAEHQGNVIELSTGLGAISADYAGLAEVEAVRDELSELQEGVAIASGIAAQIGTLEYRIVLAQTWQEVLKTQLYLTEGNVGDAETTLGLATAHFSQASELIPQPESEETVEAFASIRTHLTQAAGRLREQPIIAAQDLESAWYELGALITTPEEAP